MIGVDKMLITQEIQKIKNNFNQFFKSWMLSEVKFNDFQSISR